MAFSLYSVICFGRPKEANTVLSKLGIGRQGQELMFTRRGQADEVREKRKALKSSGNSSRAVIQEDYGHMCIEIIYL